MRRHALHSFAHIIGRTMPLAYLGCGVQYLVRCNGVEGWLAGPSLSRATIAECERPSLYEPTCSTSDPR